MPSVEERYTPALHKPRSQRNNGKQRFLAFIQEFERHHRTFTKNLPDRETQMPDEFKTNASTQWVPL